MARSSQQDAILAALPNRDERPIPCSEIFKRLGVDNPSPSQRASLSRSLTRLIKAGDVAFTRPRRFRQGQGVLYAHS